MNPNPHWIDWNEEERKNDIIKYWLDTMTDIISLDETLLCPIEERECTNE